MTSHDHRPQLQPQPRKPGQLPPVCLVTGSTSGIGRATAAGLARAGAHVIVTGRRKGRTDAVVAELRHETGSGRITGVAADLSAQAEVRRLAEEVTARHDRLDVLINNAAAGRSEQELSADGIERTWAVNYLAPFMLTGLLLERLIATAPARVVNVTSPVQRIGRLNLDDPQFNRRRFRPLAAFAQAKLAGVLFSVELAEHLRGTGVTVNCVDPGGARTAMGGSLDAPGPARVAARLSWLLSGSAERAALGPLYLATSPDVAGTTGQYFAGRPPRPRRLSALTQDIEARERLWKISAEMTGLTP
jgi:NAD(P)-dependent dehydrogenase (short-subunit alcohol dehydrogenase family)